MLREPETPFGKVREHQHALARGVHGVDDLLQPRQLARPAGERLVVVLIYADGMVVQICLSVVIAARI